MCSKMSGGGGAGAGGGAAGAGEEAPPPGAAVLRARAAEFLASRRRADLLADTLHLLELESDSYTAPLLALEVIFVELLKRGDLRGSVIPLRPTETSPELEYKRWLLESYETTWKLMLGALTRGRTNSRLQALVTAMKLLGAEGRWPIDAAEGFYFPAARLKSIFTVLLHSEISMSAPITRFQEFVEYSDVAQYGLKVLSLMGYRKSPTAVYMNNYLELLDKLLAAEPAAAADRSRERGEEEEEAKVLCTAEGKPSFTYNSVQCRRYANRCWGFACQWPLCSDGRTHRRALLLLVERLMPLLNKPQLATDMLMDSLDAGGAISMLALQGVLELVRRHNIDYPDIYDRLYAMFEPEMFATRYKQRLVHLSDVFLSSTHLPESLVAAFAKRLSRLCLVAPPEDTVQLLQLIANLLHRHPGLKRMICYEDTPTIMSADPYVMEETSTSASQALGSSLWEVSALQQHWLPAVSSAAARVLAAVDARRDQPLDIALPEDVLLFDAELKKRFKSIEMNFIRPQSMALPSGERLLHYWQIMA